MEHNEGTVEQHPATAEDTCAYFESLYNNLVTEVEKVNTVNCKMKETNADLTIKLARYKNQEKCFEINQEKYDKLERCYQKSIYQEQCLTKKINALHLAKEKTTVSFIHKEKKPLKSDFKIRDDGILEKQIQLEKKIKELDNILVKTGQSIQTMHMLSPKPNSFYHTEQKMAFGYQNPFYLKQAQQKQQAKSREELYFSNTSKIASVSKSGSKSISISNEEFLDDTSPSVARKFLNEVKGTIVTLQHEIFPIVNQVYTRVQNFKIQFLKEAAKFVRDFRSLAKDADESLAKHNALEYEIDRLLKAVVSQDIMSIVQNNSLVDTSNLQTELDRTKEKLETCIIKKEKEYPVLWNNWYKKCEECKYENISYDKAYKDMQNKLERLQAQLGDLKGKSSNTQCASNTLDPLSQKLEDENVSLEF
ncbi:hypothetical protein Tco_0273236 [Tanacetum coccineum]